MALRTNANHTNNANAMEYMYAFKPTAHGDENDEDIVAKRTNVELTSDDSETKESREISEHVQMLRDARDAETHEVLNAEFKQRLRVLLTIFHEEQPNDHIREMHQIRTLIELFEFLNEPKYEKVLMDSRNLQFRHNMLTRCRFYKQDAKIIMNRRNEELRRSVGFKPLKNDCLKAAAYNTFYCEELCDKTDAFYYHYCNKL